LPARFSLSFIADRERMAMETRRWPGGDHRRPLACVVALAGVVAATGWQMSAAAVPAADHVVVVVMENHGYDEVSAAPYTASLIAAGAVFTEAHAVMHPSQPNYFALWSADLLGIWDDTCPAPGSPFDAENFGHACEVAGISWRAYCENLPYAGCPVCEWDFGLYHRRHCPWTNFRNLDHANERPFTDLALDIASGNLPRLAFVVPNNCHNTHDCPVLAGDDWLAQNLPPLLAAIGPRGLLILTWDEDDDTAANHILTVFAGDLVQPGQASMQVINHLNVVRTVCEALGIPPFGLATSVESVTGVWRNETAVDDQVAMGRLLGPIAPNPSAREFRAAVRLGADVVPVRADVYDVAGRFVTTLLTGSYAGNIGLRWDGRDAAGHVVGRGVYVLRVKAADRVEARKLTISP
jgi:phosphatidylinositol-3-phosphatase